MKYKQKNYSLVKYFPLILDAFLIMSEEFQQDVCETVKLKMSEEITWMMTGANTDV